MQKFNKLSSIPAYLPIVNIDTDMIIPKQFLKTIKRTGLGKNLFFEMRYDDQGNEIKDFILNQKPFNQSKILIAGKNFGCGSSREHAPWALLDFGITCVISSSYADIFYNNCFKNGILPIKIDEEEIKSVDEEGKPKYLQVTVGEESFWTTGELLAGGQDLERLFKTANSMDLIVKFRGKGMGAKLWEIEKPVELKGYREWGM